MPPGGAGLYFFFIINFLSGVQEYSDFLIRVNGAIICRAYTDINSSGVNDRANPSCGAVVTLAQGTCLLLLLLLLLLPPLLLLLILPLFLQVILWMCFMMLEQMTLLLLITVHLTIYSLDSGLLQNN